MQELPREGYGYEMGVLMYGPTTRTASVIALIWLSVWRLAYGAGTSNPSTTEIDWSTLSLEQLASAEIISVGKKTQTIANAPAAIFVITQEDMRRSGVTTIPEALRLAPGLQVARIDANKWAVTSRGFNGRFANKLLVLMDGRTLYTPLFSGVYWELQDTLIEDIERIEVIRGPGATLWGANAVNGVINIITKHSRDTRGGLVTAGTGTEERGFGGLRYGAQLGEDAFFRVYAKYFNRDDSVDLDGEAASDAWQMARAGIRLDWQATGHDKIMVQGDLYSGEAGRQFTTAALSPPFSQAFENDAKLSGSHILTRWQHAFTEKSDMALQLYFDHLSRDIAVGEEVRHIFDLDLQHRLQFANRHEVVWGLSYRLTQDKIQGDEMIRFEPESRTEHLFSAFVQDEITLVPDQLRLTLGIKLEHNDFTGFEYQPNVRVLWTPHPHHSVWAAVSRAVRTPSLAEHNIRFTQVVLPPGTFAPGSPLARIEVIGNQDVVSEELLAYELGYRVQPSDSLSMDLAVFYNVYDNLGSLESGDSVLETTSAPPHLVIPTFTDNKMAGEAYGLEVSGSWQATDWWRFHLAYTYLQLQLRVDNDSNDTLSAAEEDSSPHHQISVRSLMSLPYHLELDLWMRYVDTVPRFNISHYVTLDVRVGWRPLPGLEFVIVGQNLVDNHHREIDQTFIMAPSLAVERGIYGKVIWRF